MTTEGTADGPGGGSAVDGRGTESDGGQRISTREAARRLGVKPETLYAYVSRGLLSSRRVPGGRGSTFDPAQVAALARRGRPSAQDAPAPPDESWAPIRTGITLIEPDRVSFRGVDATALARAYGYEEVADWLWTGQLRPGTRFTAPPEPLAAARKAAGSLGEGCSPMDRLRVAVIAAASADPLRFDLTPEAVIGSARNLVAVLAEALPPVGPPPRGNDPLARRLWSRLTPLPADGAAPRVLDAALTLLIDHDLAASTLAARVAASARAHPYAVVSAGLGALDGPLHGQASALVHRMLDQVRERGAATVVAEHLRAGRRLPGLGHRLYRGEDPRAAMLFALLDDVPTAAAPLAAARDVLTTAARHTALHANVDLALGVLSTACAMPPEAGEVIFSLARTAGWIAHALEEYAAPPLRLRPTGHYDGPAAGRETPTAP